MSVIVLTYNARAFVDRCLAAALAQDYADFELIVVDNASTDGTVGHVRACFPSVRLIAARRNAGWGAGNNLGAAAASGEVFAFLNPDAVPEVQWLSSLIMAMQQSGRQLATSLITLQSNVERLNSAGNQIHYLGLSFCRGVGAPRSQFVQQELVSGASGAACAITRTLFERIGGFDELFFLYHDDVDLSVRALLAGERCLYVPEAVVAHDYEVSLPPAKWAWIEAYRWAILIKIYRFRTLALLVPALVALEILTLLHLATRGPEYVKVKLGTYVWLLHNISAILRKRARAQRTRGASDRALLEVLVDTIPYEQVAGSVVSNLARVVVDAPFRAYRRLCLSVVNW